MSPWELKSKLHQVTRVLENGIPALKALQHLLQQPDLSCDAATWLQTQDLTFGGLTNAVEAC